MGRIDFYILNRSQQDSYLYLCRLVEKGYQLKNHVHIHTHSPDVAKRLDDLLWTYNETSFLPHNIIASEEDFAPITLSYPGHYLPKRREILINLLDDIPDFHKDFERVIELVYSDESIQKSSRQKYRKYQSFGCQINTFNIN